MTISPEELKKVASLARLSIDEQLLPVYMQKINSVLAMIAEMEKANTEDIKPLSHPLEITQRLRSDEISEANQRESFQAIAPKTSVGLYLVPKVIE